MIFFLRRDRVKRSVESIVYNTYRYIITELSLLTITLTFVYECGRMSCKNVL